MMTGRRIIAGLAVALLLVGTGCSDDSGATTDGGTDVADGGDDGGDAADSGGDDLEADAADVEEEVVERTCGRPPSQDETVTYDALSPLAEFVGVAETTKAGLDVSIVIPDPDNPDDPTTFDGSFEAGTRCVAAETQGISANLCFFNADGTPAEAETLAAQIFAFIAGGPTDRPNGTLLGGVRRGLDLSCSLAGFFPLDTEGLQETGNLPASVAPDIEEALLGYLALFEIGGGRVDTAMGVVPIIESAVAADVATGDIEVEIITGIELDVDATPTEYDVTITIDATVDLDSGALTGTMTVEIEGDNDVAGTLAGDVSGVRG